MDKKPLPVKDFKTSQKRSAADSTEVAGKRSKSLATPQISAYDLKQMQLKLMLRKMPTYKYKPHAFESEAAVTSSNITDAITASLPPAHVDSMDDLGLPRTTLPWPAHRDLYSH